MLLISLNTGHFHFIFSLKAHSVIGKKKKMKSGLIFITIFNSGFSSVLFDLVDCKENKNEVKECTPLKSSGA